MATFMDKLPTVISCCFCCFLRAGTVMIATFTFLLGLLFAPNVSYAKGFWNMDLLFNNYGEATETWIHMMLGIASIMLCVVSALLIVGACCNFPKLILIYQWGLVLYSAFVVLLFSILITFCFFIHSNCYSTGGVLCAFILINVLLTAYFVVVVNSLRVSLTFLSSGEYLTA